MNKQEAKEKIEELISKFSSQVDYYKSASYNETQTRSDFVDAFFAALGWDMENDKGKFETQRDVIQEYRLRTNGRKQKPDYCFNTNGKGKFLVEAKKPSIAIKDNPEPALQLRSYGWNAKLSISVLTDFEEFAIYDCTRKRRKNDTAISKRLKYIYYTDYLKEFDFIWNTFAYENVVNGSIEKYAKSKIDFKEAEPVDKEFLLSLNTWREYLATNLANNHTNLSEEDINFAVQQTIDRIIFLRVCEDRNVEPEEQLLKIAKAKGDIYQNLFATFQTANQKYNSGLFDFSKDKITKNVSIDNKVIKNIIIELYETDYNFAIIPVEILGYAYEQFLGKVIRLTAVNHAVIEEKPEVRKAGGVYYTPDYIVNYIVGHTVGALIENKTPEEVSKIKILDPSCGSGSFLLGAYQFLLDWHLKYYIKNTHTYKNKKENPLSEDGKQLISWEKKRILLNNIYGVDIDTQAVEVSKLSLLLKALEGETEASIQTSLQIFNERVLPTIDGNIQCGNSLIAPDFYNDGLFLTPKEERKINVFDWKEAFPDVFSQGGFDCIIGNPPYVTLQLGKKQTSQEKYFLTYYQLRFLNSFEYKINLFALFMEKSTSLLKANGLFSYIVPNAFYNAFYFSKLRKYLLEKGTFDLIFDLRFKVFEQVEIGGNAVFVFRNEKAIQENIIPIYVAENFEQFLQPIIKTTNSKNILESENHVFTVEADFFRIDSKIKKVQTIPLGEITKIYQGIITGDNKKYLSDKAQNEKWQKIIRGRDINRYSIEFNDNYVFYEPSILWSNTNIDMFKVKEKIISRQTSDHLVGSIDTNGYFSLDSTHVIHLKKDIFSLYYLLAIFNSKLINYIYQSKVKEIGRVFAQVKTVNLKTLPIKTIDFQNQTQKAQHDQIVKFVEMMLELHKRLQVAKLQTDKDQLNRRIKSTQNEIDKLVYQLYGITEETDIEMIEGKN